MPAPAVELRSPTPDAPIDFGNGASENQSRRRRVSDRAERSGGYRPVLWFTRSQRIHRHNYKIRKGREKAWESLSTSSITWEKAGYYPDFREFYGPGPTALPHTHSGDSNIDVPEGFPAKGQRLTHELRRKHIQRRQTARAEIQLVQPRHPAEWTLTPFVGNA